MARYVDGFLLPIPTKNIDAYTKMSKKASKVWLEHGALEYIECVGDDLTVQGKALFPKAAKAKPGETVVFSWIIYKSKAQRDKIMKKVMTDKRLAAMMDPNNMPFDMKRMLYGGFKTIVEA